MGGIGERETQSKYFVWIFIIKNKQKKLDKGGKHSKDFELCGLAWATYSKFQAKLERVRFFSQRTSSIGVIVRLVTFIKNLIEMF